MTAYDLGWPLAAIGAVWLLIHGAQVFGRWLLRLADVHVDQAVAKALADGEVEWDEWLADVPGLDETPIYTATAAHIAEHAAARLDDEWAALNGGRNE